VAPPLPRKLQKKVWPSGARRHAGSCSAGLLIGPVTKGDYEKIVSLYRANHPFLSQFETHFTRGQRRRGDKGRTLISEEGPGYRDAANYIDGAQIPANGDLLAMILGRMPHPAMLQIAQAVMPNGFSAFIRKPEIPTYLVGSLAQIEALYALVPAPAETYCELFWPLDTSRLDVLLKDRHQQRRDAKKSTKTS
jgi:hypothetical protein